MTEGGAHEAVEQQEADDEHDQNEEIELRAGPLADDIVQELAEVRALDADDAVRTVRDRAPLARDGAQQLAERHGDEQEVRAGEAEREPADDGGENRADHDGDEQHEPEVREVEVLEQETDRVAAHTEERGMTEGAVARVAHDDVKTHGE